MTSRSAGAIVALLCWAVGCSHATNPGDPRSELDEALQATIAAQSFAMSSTIRYEGKVVAGEVRYIAPDRYSITSSGEELPTTIGVGRVTYFAVPGDPGRYYRSESSCDIPVDEVISALEVVDTAREVVFSNGTYRFQVPNLGGADADSEIEGEVTISGGYLASVHLRYHLPALDSTVDEMHRFHDFGTHFTVEPPPAERVVGESDEFNGVINILPTPTPTCPV